jgi:erythromycin esterase-like protein
MPISPDVKLSNVITSSAQVLTGAPNDHDALLDMIGQARFVLLGGASHGTHEFYAERARITRRLIEEKGFTAVALDADWPDAYRVNRYVHDHNSDTSAEQALTGFTRFPAWMWRNTELVRFVEWLRAHNDALPAQSVGTGVYGLDLYSQFASMAEVLVYLDRVDPESALLARRRYACLDHFSDDSQPYGCSAGYGLASGCEQEVVAQLQGMLLRSRQNLLQNGQRASDALFYAQQNVHLVANAQRYYRTMFRGRVSSWNLRDHHMTQTLDALEQHLTDANRERAKIVVWAHNSHVGDARATEFGSMGVWNIGQLMRERHGRDAVLIGFSTGHGTVTAASDWDEPAVKMRFGNGLSGSYEDLFHQTGIARFMLNLRDNSQLRQLLGTNRLQRAIGVIYRPETERASHYCHAKLSQQFDAILHFDETHPLEPLEHGRHWSTGEVSETFQVGV